jgi:sugar/nucleoside kinase (ribokinase family)
MELIVIGSVAYDSIETPSGVRERVLGGSACYFSIAASFFDPPGLVAVIGEDFENSYLQLLEKYEIDLKGLERAKGKTFHWKGKYEDLNEAITLRTDLNVIETFDPKVPEEYSRAKSVFLANIDPELQEKVLEQIEGPQLVACDTMNFWIISKHPELMNTLKKVNILLINDAEAMQLSEQDNVFKAGEWILENGPDTVVIKRGEFGSLLMKGNDKFIFPAFPLTEVKDPTGAGDSFAGGFVGYLHATNDHSFENMKTALALGTVMASFTVEDFSVDRLTSTSYAEVENRYRKLIDYTNLKPVNLATYKRARKIT